jgi:hypothetical protein
VEGLLAAAEGGVMARFKFFLIGTTEAPVVEVEADSLRDLGEMAMRHRFVEGRMVEINGEGASCGVLIPTGRVQMIAEVDDFC